MQKVDQVREIALALPGVQEGNAYGTPAFRVNKKLFLRMWEDGETLVTRVDPQERDLLMKASPGVLYLTDHYRPYPWVLVLLPAVTFEDLRERIIDAWREAAPSRLAKAYDDQLTQASRSRPS